VSNYRIECPACGGYYPARKMVDGGYMCLNCYSAFEQTGELIVVDLDVVEKYRKEFIGAKIAGMIKEKEFEGDREQMKQEKW